MGNQLNELKRLARRDAEGFTMIELVIIIAIVGILAGTFVKYIDEGTRMFEAVDTRKEIMMEARQALIRTTREVRQIRSRSDVLSADAQNLSFVGVDDSTYTLSFSGTPGDDLVFQRGAVTAPIASAVDSLAFSYYRSDGTPAVPLVSPSDSDIYRVGIFLRLARGSDDVSLKVGTFVRNMR